MKKQEMSHSSSKFDSVQNSIICGRGFERVAKIILYLVLTAPQSLFIGQPYKSNHRPAFKGEPHSVGKFLGRRHGWSHGAAQTWVRLAQLAGCERVAQTEGFAGGAGGEVRGVLGGARGRLGDARGHAGVLALSDAQAFA